MDAAFTILFYIFFGTLLLGRTDYNRTGDLNKEYNIPVKVMLKPL